MTNICYVPYDQYKIDEKQTNFINRMVNIEIMTNICYKPDGQYKIADKHEKANKQNDGQLDKSLLLIGLMDFLARNKCISPKLQFFPTSFS